MATFIKMSLDLLYVKFWELQLYPIWRVWKQIRKPKPGTILCFLIPDIARKSILHASIFLCLIIVLYLDLSCITYLFSFYLLKGKPVRMDDSILAGMRNPLKLSLKPRCFRKASSICSNKFNTQSIYIIHFPLCLEN